MYKNSYNIKKLSHGRGLTLHVVNAWHDLFHNNRIAYIYIYIYIYRQGNVTVHFM
jgi:hypothetical protein